MGLVAEALARSVDAQLGGVESWESFPKRLDVGADPRATYNACS